MLQVTALNDSPDILVLILANLSFFFTVLLVAKLVLPMQISLIQGVRLFDFFRP